jgi:hypothetical protein
MGISGGVVLSFFLPRQAGQVARRAGGGCLLQAPRRRIETPPQSLRDSSPAGRGSKGGRPPPLHFTNT